MAGGRIRLREDAYPAADEAHAARARALLVRVRRFGFEVARSSPWPETLSVLREVEFLMPHRMDHVDTLGVCQHGKNRCVGTPAMSTRLAMST